MDLKSGYPFWAIKNGLMHAFSRLEDDLACEVVVVGGGITGALIANELAAHGHEVAVIEQRDIGWGSSAASTALLQYEIDTHMVDLARRYGEDQAALAYGSCAEAIPLLQDVAREFRDVEFARNRSLYYASKSGHLHGMRDELAMRERHGLEVEWLGPDRLSSVYGIESPGAILSRLAAQVDPYRLASRLLARLQRTGTAVHDRTAVEAMTQTTRSVTLTTDQGSTIRARHAVLAGGYANEKWLSQRVARNRSSYAFVTDPLADDVLGRLKNTMVWESARPYLYLRSTRDGRLLVGGEDDDIDIPARRDRRVDKKASTLAKKVAKAMPGRQLTPTFAWGGTFAETADGLPFFGAHPERGNRVLFAMAYGGNGITYSMLGAGLVRSLIERKRHPLANLFSFERINRSN